MAKSVDVVGAVIEREGRILCAQRGFGGALAGMWEFPGGKVEAGEDRREALIRELREELDCEVVVGDVVTTTVHSYDFAVVTLTTFMCTLVGDEPRLSEHEAVVWLSRQDLTTLDWAPADVPAVQLLAAGVPR